MIVGNDIAVFQKDIDWETYKKNSNFVIIKSTEGVGFTDPKFSRNQSEARRVGMAVGYYHFARPDLGNTPETEADYFLKVVGAPKDGEVFCLDYEPPSQIQAHVDWCRKFMDRIFEKIGVRCLIYLNQSQVKKFDWRKVIDGNYGLWIAAYTFNPNNNSFETGQWPGAVMQQWTNGQTVPGIPTPADGDAFFGDIATFKKYGYKTPPAPPAPTPPGADDFKKKIQTYFNFEISAEDVIKFIEERKKEINTLNGAIDIKNAKIKLLTEKVDSFKAKVTNYVNGL